MTPDSLRAICDSLNPGGQSKLARILDWHHSTVWRKLTGKSQITQSDAMAIQAALNRHLASQHALNIQCITVDVDGLT